MKITNEELRWDPLHESTETENQNKNEESKKYKEIYRMNCLIGYRNSGIIWLRKALQKSFGETPWPQFPANLHHLQSVCRLANLPSAILWWLCKHPQHFIAESHHTSGTPLFSIAIAVPSFTLRTALSATPFVSERGGVLVSCLIVNLDKLGNIFYIVLADSFWLSRRDKKSW